MPCGALNALDGKLRAVLEGKIRRCLSCRHRRGLRPVFGMPSRTRAAIKKRRQRARWGNEESPRLRWPVRPLLVAAKASVPRARLHEDFSHSCHRGAPHVGIERLAAQPLGDRLQIHVL